MYDVGASAYRQGAAAVNNSGPSILVLASGHQEPSFRFRVLQFLPSLKRTGFNITLVDLADGSWPLGRLYRELPAFDLVWVHRALIHTPHWLVLRRRSRGYVYELDDAVYLRDSNSRKGYYSTRRRFRFRRIAGGALLVIAGNRYLAQAVEPHQPRVRVVPTAVEMQANYARRPERNGKITLGWIGTAPNLRYLTQIGGAIATAKSVAPEIRLKVVCDRFPAIDGVALVSQPWSLQTELADVSSFDVGLMPLPDDPWTRGKCGLKALQYMAAGVPSICSPVGMLSDLISHGVNGLLASRPDEWTQSILALTCDDELRRRVGLAGRRTVERAYSVSSVFPQLLSVLSEAMCR